MNEFLNTTQEKLEKLVNKNKNLDLTDMTANERIVEYYDKVYIKDFELEKYDLDKYDKDLNYLSENESKNLVDENSKYILIGEF